MTDLPRPRGYFDILAACRNVKQAGSPTQHKAACPVPGHETPDGHLSLEDAGDKCLVKCFGSNHSYEEIVAGLGFSTLNYGDDNHNNNGHKKTRGQLVATYDYRDSSGELLFQTCRFMPKDFSQRRPDPERPDGWIYNLKGIRRVLYRLPELTAGIGQGEVVVVVEGERDADVAATMGLCSTSSPLGAGKWQPEYTEMLSGANLVVIVADKDKPGREHADMVARQLHAGATPAKVIELPGEAVKDFSDWAGLGGTREQFDELVEEAPLYEPPVEAQSPTSANSSGSNDDISEHLTDDGNAAFIAKLFGDRIRFDCRRQRWLIWQDHRWAPDVDGEIYRLAKEATHERFRRSVLIQDLRQRATVAAFAISSENKGRRDAALAHAQRERPIADAGDSWDTDPWLLGCKNGVIDLRTGKLRPGRRDDRITMSTGIDYDSAAKCPRWLQHLDEVTGGLQELVDWYWRALGYSITGTMSEQCFFLLFGLGANGKGKTVEGVRIALGDYAYDAPFSTFERDFRANIPNDVAALVGRRFVTASETNDGTRLNEARIKAITGCDPATARFLNHEFFTFQPMCKLWLLVNHKPRVTDDSYGFWRRARMLPFTQQFSGTREDRKLSEKFKAEAPGILAWLVRGCVEWQTRGLDPMPDCVRLSTEEWKRESDPLAEFEDEVIIKDERSAIQAKALFAAYSRWAEARGMKGKEVMTSTAFGREMGRRFLKKTSGVTRYYGIKTKEIGESVDSLESKTNVAGGLTTLFPSGENSIELREEECKNYPKPSNPPEQPLLDDCGGSVPQAADLPDCKNCGECDWIFTGDGQRKCSKCGWQEE